MSDFTRSLLKIAVPVTLQCLLQSSFSIIDQMMIGQLGKESIAAVGIFGNYSLVFTVVIGAVCSVAGILISQFLGAQDPKEAWAGFHISTLVSALISAIFMGILFFFTDTVLGFYTEDPGIIKEGITYCRLVSITFLPIGISLALSTWLRCKEHAVFPLIASICAVLSNTALNYVLIFGKFGMPVMAVKGAAIATTVSQVLNLFLIILGFCFSNRLDHGKIHFIFRMKKISVREYLCMLLPILLSEFLWSLGQNVETAVYGHIGTDSLAAYTLTCPIQGLLIGALSGLSASAGVMVGKRLGEKDWDGAFAYAGKLLLCGILGSILTALLLILTSRYYVSLYQVEDTVKHLGRSVLIVFALYAPFKVSNMILGGGVIKSGGDTKTIMWIDICGTWLFGIPLCLFAACILKQDLVVVYALLTSEEILRFAVTCIVFRRKKWMNSFS